MIEPNERGVTSRAGGVWLAPLCAGIAMMMAGALTTAACGGSDGADAFVEPDAAPEGSLIDSGSGPNASGDSAAPNATPAADAAVACSGSNTPCTVGTQKGLCSGGTCAACAGPVADSLCVAAYGAGNICSAGACVDGCRTSATCSGKLCGRTTPNVCGGCTADAQCTADPAFGAGTACDTATGSCVSAASCTPLSSACSVGAKNGLCTAAGCTVCTEPTDDAKCAGAYGAGFICAAGSCAAGCRTSATCGGKLCGVTTANVCGGCTTNVQCQGDPAFGPSTVCNVGTGTCVAAVACAPLDSACNAGVQKGLCNSAGCTACNDPSDDGRCATAYGASFICKAGSCSTGCRTSATCGAKLCGVTTPNTCGSCTNDLQCQNDPSFGPTSICNGAGNCVAAPACGTPNTTCPTNAAAECCTITAQNVCVAGNCCTDAQCATAAKPVCVNHACAACDAVAAPWYYHVDPVNGSDALASSGSGKAGGAAASSCAFKTVTHALEVILAATAGSPKAGTRVIIDVASTVGAGETFPIAVPSNVTVLGAPSTLVFGAPTVSVNPPSGGTGFAFASASSGLRDLFLDGGPNSATTGVSVTTGGAATLNHVFLRSFGGDGIVVSGTGTLDVTNGTGSRENNRGLRVTGSAKATISGVTSAAPTAFSRNGADGILVDMSGSITILGAPAPAAGPDAGTVVVNDNGDSGVTIRQALGVAPPVNTIDGLVAYRNGADGITVYGGSALTLRRSTLLRNGDNGVLVATNPAGGIGSNTLTAIDLGTAAQFGKNVVQTAGGDANDRVGICLDLDAPSATALSAAGNIFGAALDCSTMAKVLTKNTCGGGTFGTVGIRTTLSNTITASMCTIN